MKLSLNNRKHNRHTGMTLVEVVVAAALFALVLTSSLTATSQVMLLTETSVDRGRALDWIQSEIEYIRTLSWTDMQNLTSNSDFAQPKPDEKYISSRLVQDRNNNQKIVRLVVMWNDSRGQFHTSSIVTFVNRYGI